MKIKFGYSLAEAMVTMVVMAFLLIVSLPSIKSNSDEKMFSKGYKKAYETVSDITKEYLSGYDNVIDTTEANIIKYIKFFIENSEIKELYADSEPTKESDTYSALKFANNVVAGAKNPKYTSNELKLTTVPTFWFTTDDNIAYSIIVPKNAKCDEVLNINISKNLNDTIESSCFLVLVDTNGLFSNPNKIEDTQDISNEQYIPNLKNDRYYIFIGSNGVASGNPKHVLSATINVGHVSK